MTAAMRGELSILFIAPERLDNLETYEFLTRLHVSLLVVDEAHCISTWGHDFRPSYRLIVNAVRDLERTRPDLHVLGLTATADARIEQDIAAQLRDPQKPLTVHRATMDRPNLALSMFPIKGLSQKLAVLEKLVSQQQGCGILYCATREQTETVARYLAERGQDVIAYHAGLEPQRKRTLQHDFLDGRHKAIAATNALGMGIDKPDIRFIIHVDVPGSITAYYQEVGRAGRDGEHAVGILLYDADDRTVQDYFIRSSQPVPADFARVLECLEPDLEGQPPRLGQVRSRSGLHPTRVTVVMAELVDQGFIEKRKRRGGQGYARLSRPGEPDLSRYQRQGEVRNRELQAMLTYAAEGGDCRMAILRRALGDQQTRACGHCDLCAPSTASRPDPQALEHAKHWVDRREVIIPASRIPVYHEGRAIFDATLRGAAFAGFMRHRARSEISEVENALKDRIAQTVADLATQHTIGLVLLLPTRTWAQGVTTGTFIADRLQAIFRSDLLVWQDWPQHRQGELLNNDQRKENVKDKMRTSGALPSFRGSILLLDDYTGSGNTLKEAVRVLRKQAGYKGSIIPMTIARLKWRLGARGFV